LWQDILSYYRRFSSPLILGLFKGIAAITVTLCSLLMLYSTDHSLWVLWLEPDVLLAF
jgi:hypothetical protein